MSCLNRFKGWCQENFPFIEDDFNAITDYQLMCKLKEYVVSIGNDVANLEIDYNELAGKIVELEEIVNNMDGEFDDLVEEFNSLKTLVESYNMRIIANANRIEQVNTNLQQLISLNINEVKDLINELKDYVDDQDTLILADISTINENIVLIQKDIEVIAEAIPKVRDTGTVITLNDTIKDAHIDIKLDPSELSQETTTGKNILPLIDGSGTIGNVAYTIEDGIIKINGTTSTGSSNKYFDVFQTNSGNAVIWLEVTGYTDPTQGVSSASIIIQQSDDGSSNWTNLREVRFSSTATKQYSITLDSSKYYRLRWYCYESTFTNATIKAMLEYGDEKTSWEKYTGGLPQPNPTYPSDVHVISGDNSIVVSNSDNTLSQVKPLNLGDIEYCKIGNYQDHFFKAIDGDSIYGTLDSTTKASLTSDKWYIQGRITPFKFVGADSESYTKMYSSIQQGKAIYSLDNVPHNNSNYQLLISNRFVSRSGYTAYYGEGLNCTRNNTSLVLILSSDRISEYSTEALQTFFQNNHTTIYVVNETPTYTLLNDTLQQQLDDIYETLKAYNDQTNITQINHDLPFIMTAITMKKGSVTDEV